MTAIGYLYSPALLQEPAQTDIDHLLEAGAETVYVDWGSRVYFTKLQNELSQGLFSTLVLARLEDLGDTLSDIHQLLLHYQSLGITLQLIDEVGTQSLQSSTAWIQVLADLPSALQRRRLLQSHVQNRLDIKPPPGRAPFGYRREQDRYVLDRKQATVIKDFFEHFLIYGSIRAAVRHLAQQHGKRISVATGRRWLMNPVYRGDLQFVDGKTIRNTHNPILSRQEAAQIDRWLKRNRGIAPRSASASRSLAGLVSCQACQRRLRIIQVTQRNHSQPYLYLRCETCRYSLSYSDTLNQVIQQVCQQLPQQTQHFDPAPIAQAQTSIETKINTNEVTLKQIQALRDQGVLSDQVIQQQTYQLKAENATLLEQLAQLPPQNLPEIAQTLSLEPFWHDLSESERRSYFREFIESIQVDQAGNLTIVFFF